MVITTLGFMSITACGGSLVDIPNVQVTESTDANGNTTYSISGVTDTSSIQDPNSGETVDQIIQNNENSEPLNVFAIDSQGNKIKNKVKPDGNFSLDVDSHENYMIGFSLYDGDEEIFVGNINYSVDDAGKIVDRSPSINANIDLGRVSFSNGHGHCEKNPFRKGDHSDFNYNEFAYGDQELRLECHGANEEDFDEFEDFDGEEFDLENEDLAEADEFDDEDGEDLDDVEDDDELAEENEEGNRFVQADLNDEAEELDNEEFDLEDEDLAEADDINDEDGEDLDNDDLDGEDELDDEESGNELLICEYIEDDRIIEDDYIDWDINDDIEDGNRRPLWRDFCGGEDRDSNRGCLRMVKLCHDICELDQEQDRLENQLDRIQGEEFAPEENNFRDLKAERRSCMRECLF